MTRQPTKEQNILAKMAFTLIAIINRANQFNIDLKTICSIHQLLEFIINFNIEHSADFTHILAALNLYAVVLLKIDDFENENIFSLIVKLQQDILTAAHNIIQHNIDNTINNYQIFYLNIMKPIVAICYAGMKLCENDDLSLNKSPDSTNKGDDFHGNRLTPIIHIICKTMLHCVIPNAKMPNDYYNENNDREMLIYLVNCLSSLYRRPDVDLNEFSFHLVEQGYLKYLFRFIDCREDFWTCICDCIANIITDLSQIYLALDKWSDGRQGFRRFIKSALLKFGNQREVNCATTDACLFILYFHFLFTRDLEIIDTIKALSLMTRIINISAENLPEIPILQMILFLFATTALEGPTEHLEEEFPYALLKTVEILNVVGLENCYTHHPILPCFILQNSVFPLKMRHDVVKLWLKLEENTCHLVSPGGMQILINCLLNIIQTSAEDLIVERAMNELSRILRDSNDSPSLIEQQTTQFMWENLPQVFTNFMNNDSSENNIYNYLKMLNRLSNLNVSILSAIRCSNSLITVLNCEKTINGDIKTLLVKQMSKMLNVDLIAKDGRVVSVYTNNYKLLNELRANAFSREHDNLSAACYKCLADILLSQKQLSIKCTEPVSLCPMDLFNALLRKAHVSFDVMSFLDKIWIGEIEHPAILRPAYTEEEAKNILNGIYRNVITLAISCNYYGKQYFEFANTWLQYGLYTRCSFVVDALRAKSLIDKRQQNGVFDETSFVKALRELKAHIQKCIASGFLQANYVKELQSTVTRDIYLRHRESV
ncbi:hypothetical protein PV325_000509 [Microctonus aethiopoides]|nr:hypothetical protein PV325_000509 [Microctonus aethiopoides]